MSFHDLKAQARRVVHSVTSIPCVLNTGSRSVTISARYHVKLGVGGDLQPGLGYAGIREDITAVVFNREELAGVSVVPARNMTVTFPNYLAVGQHLVVQLDGREPYDGPITEKWTVGAHS